MCPSLCLDCSLPSGTSDPLWKKTQLGASRTRNTAARPTQDTRISRLCHGTSKLLPTSGLLSGPAAWASLVSCCGQQKVLEVIMWHFEPGQQKACTFPCSNSVSSVRTRYRTGSPSKTIPDLLASHLTCRSIHGCCWQPLTRQQQLNYQLTALSG